MGQQHFQRERLHQIVIRAGFKAAHLIFRSLARGKHQNRCPIPTQAQAAADLQSIHSGQHTIQQNQSKTAFLCSLPAPLTIGEMLHGVARAAQRQSYQVCQLFLVFNIKYRHDLLVE